MDLYRRHSYCCTYIQASLLLLYFYINHSHCPTSTDITLTVVSIDTTLTVVPLLTSLVLLYLNIHRNYCCTFAELSFLNRNHFYYCTSQKRPTVVPLQTSLLLLYLYRHHSYCCTSTGITLTVLSLRALLLLSYLYRHHSYCCTSEI